MFTIFSENWDHACLSHEKITRAAVQKEKAPETGREHFQGYLSLTAPMRLSGVKAILKDDTAHLEVCKGTPKQSWDYCTKEDTRIDGPWTYGEAPKGQGARYVCDVGGVTSQSGG